MFKWIKEKLGMEEKEKLEKDELEELSDKKEAEEIEEKLETGIEDTTENVEIEEDKEPEDDSKIESNTNKDLEESETEEDKTKEVSEDIQGNDKVLEPNEETDIKEDKQQKDAVEATKVSDVEEVKEVIEESSDIKDTDLAQNEALEEQVEPQEEHKKQGFFEKLKDGLNKTRKEVGIKINTVLGNYVKIDDDMLEDLEDILISADIGMNTTMKLIDNLRDTIIREKINDPSKVKPLLMEEAKKLMNPELNTGLISESPTIILIVGVNGVGKTTTIGKLSQRFKDEGKSVLVCAADTFRAAAIDQLREWGNRSHVDVISHEEGSDPAAVVFDAIAAAKARKSDILIVDTAGRLHNKANLMKELEKINRIINKNYPEANRETLLVLDATTGQNAMNQAKTFKEASEITGIALTKLDGTAKGGVVIALQSELEIPIKLIGVGEGIYDLQDFDIDNFIEAIFE